MRSGALVLASNIADTAAVLLRNVLLARLLSVADFGVAATFSIIVTLMDAAQSAGINRMVIQAKDADTARLQDGLHAVQFALGLITSVLLLLLCWPYALAMGTPHIVWAYALLAVLPAFRGAAHLDPARLNREGRFGPGIARQLIPQYLSLAAIWPAYLLFGDYRTMIAVLFVQQLTSLLASHVGAERPFRIRFVGDVTARAFRFGWPLMVNGILMFVVINGDRMVVSNQFGLEALGWFSAAVTLTLNPAMLVARTIQTVYLPPMARAQDSPVQLQWQYDRLSDLMALAYVLFVAGVAIVGEVALVLIFGEKFRPAAPFLLLLAAMQGIRLMRAVPALAAMACAETKNPLYANIIRGVFILAALAVALSTGSIWLMLLTGIAGELVAALGAAWLARRSTALSAKHFLAAVATASLLSGAIGAAALAGWPLWPIGLAALPFLFAMRHTLLHVRCALLR